MKVIAILCIAATFVGLSLAGEGEKCNVINKRTGNVQKLDCLLDPRAVEGPYYLPLSLNRRNITEGEPGIPLALNLVVMNSVSCEPIANATVDIWHANATGVYSGFEVEGTTNLTYLRGVQVTNVNGEVTFESIYPGWYTGRCIHIHIEVFLDGRLKHVGQLYFPNIYTNAVKFVEPYASSEKILQYNEADGIFRQSGGVYTTFDNPEGSTDSGFEGLMYIGIDPFAVAEEENVIKHY